MENVWICSPLGLPRAVETGRRGRGAGKLEPMTVEAKLQNLNTSPKPFQLNVLLQLGVCETLFLLK
jgi:hypothetical protein